MVAAGNSGVGGGLKQREQEITLRTGPPCHLYDKLTLRFRRLIFVREGCARKSYMGEVPSRSRC